MADRVKPRRSEVVEVGEKVIAQLETALPIDENALDDALAHQPDAFYRVAKQLAFAISRRDAAKQFVKETEADAAKYVRETAERAKDKVTAAEVEAEVRTDKEVRQAVKEYLDADGLVHQLEALKDAFVQRSHALNKLTDLYIKNYFESSSTGGSASRLKDVTADRVRKDMAEQRRARK